MANGSGAGTSLLEETTSQKLASHLAVAQNDCCLLALRQTYRAFQRVEAGHWSLTTSWRAALVRKRDVRAGIKDMYESSCVPRN